jgi:thiol-disulfide isomerase/thioredoxin
MGKARVGTRLVAGALLLWGTAAPAWAAAPPTVSQMLSIFHPHQDGVALTTPTAQEETTCKVEGVSGHGWLLRDAKGLPVRRYYDSNGDGKIDVWSYYKDGVEVYREIDSNFDGKVDQYRWLNAGGSKWGVDRNEDGKIDAWQQISPEEVSQELLQAVITKDAGRFQLLLITDEDLKALGVSAAETTRIQEIRKGAVAKFQATAAKLNGLSDKTRWLHLETATPLCLPADQLGGTHDLVKYANGTVLCTTAEKNDWLQTGELIQVGAAWRLVEGPSAGMQEPTVPDKDGGMELADKELQPLLDQLRELDNHPPKSDVPGPNTVVARYNSDRADVLEKIVGQARPEKRDPWIRQLADCLSAAAQASQPTEKTAYNRLVSLEDQIAKAMPGSNLAAYVTFREMTAEYANKLGDKTLKVDAVQDGWLERLSKFVQTYAHAEDTPDALLQLGMVSEFANKEIEAKNWYQQLATNFADNPLAKKALGAINRLGSEGKPLELAGPTLAGGTWDVSQARGKVVVVYYWASWNNQCVGDFAKLKQLLDANGGKLEVVTVNLDTHADEANEFLKRSPAPGTHLHQDGGLDSPPAVQYGIMGLPSMFLVGKDGKVVSRSVQASTLEDELKKQLK